MLGVFFILILYLNCQSILLSVACLAFRCLYFKIIQYVTNLGFYIIGQGLAVPLRLA